MGFRGPRSFGRGQRHSHAGSVRPPLRSGRLRAEEPHRQHECQGKRGKRAGSSGDGGGLRRLDPLCILVHCAGWERLTLLLRACIACWGGREGNVGCSDAVVLSARMLMAIVRTADGAPLNNSPMMVSFPLAVRLSESCVKRWDHLMGRFCYRESRQERVRTAQRGCSPPCPSPARPVPVPARQPADRPRRRAPRRRETARAPTEG